MPSLQIPPEFERAVLDRVAEGKYESTDEVLTACLEALCQVEEFQAEELDWLRTHVDRNDT